MVWAGDICRLVAARMKAKNVLPTNVRSARVGSWDIGYAGVTRKFQVTAGMPRARKNHLAGQRLAEARKHGNAIKVTFSSLLSPRRAFLDSVDRIPASFSGCSYTPLKTGGPSGMDNETHETHESHRTHRTHRTDRTHRTHETYPFSAMKAFSALRLLLSPSQPAK
jgi:hypothetical protein